YPVASGLEPGDRVVAQGAFLLDAETRLDPSLAAGYFGAGAAASTAKPTPTDTRAWLKGLAESDRPAALRQATCPVTGEPLGSMGVPPKLTARGRDVFLCCAGCVRYVESDPDTYLAK